MLERAAGTERVLGVHPHVNMRKRRSFNANSPEHRDRFHPDKLNVLA